MKRFWFAPLRTIRASLQSTMTDVTAKLKRSCFVRCCEEKHSSAGASPIFVTELCGRTAATAHHCGACHHTLRAGLHTHDAHLNVVATRIPRGGGLSSVWKPHDSTPRALYGVTSVVRHARR